MITTAIPREQVLAVLEMLCEYYRYTLTSTQLSIYVNHLADLDPYKLRQAAESLIDRSPYFPRVSDLRSAASKQLPPDPEILFREADELRNAFFRDGSLDPDTWEDLARRLELAGYIEYAEMIRIKCHRLQTEFDEYGRLKPEFEMQYSKALEIFLNSDWESEEKDD